MLRCFFSWLSNYPSYLYLAVVWMSSVDTLCLVYTSPRRLPDLFAGPMMIRRSQIKISKADKENSNTPMNLDHRPPVVVAACAPLQRRGVLGRPPR